MACRPVMFSFFSLLLLGLVSVDAFINWKSCEGKADHPSVKEGNFYNLCIFDEIFSEQSHAWTFTKTSVSNTEFEDCKFYNTREKTSNFNESVWTDVTFTGCEFGAYNDEPTLFENVLFTNVKFEGCTFHNTANVNFTKFIMQNVSFVDVIFQSDTNFELGEMNTVLFENTRFKYSEDATTPSGDDAFRLRSITARDVNIIDSTFTNPVRFENLDGANISFNDSIVNEFWCHSRPDKKNEVKYFSRFNDTLFQQVTFKDDVHCDMTTWQGMSMGNVTFERNAYFHDSKILDIYWDLVHMESGNQEPVKLDFSNTQIKRRVLANTTIIGTADFTKSQIETVYINNFVAGKPLFSEAMFVDQEFVDGHCCSRVCVSLECKCNVSEPSGVCPVGRSDVNVSAYAGCFPGSATVSRYDGMVVSMEDLAIAEKIAIGSGQHSDVFFFGHRDEDLSVEYVSIRHTGSETPLRIAPGHYLYVDGGLQTARNVKPGHRLRDVSGEDTLFVIGVNRENHRGVYAPTTMHGDLVVDGVVVSSYTDVMHPGLAHKLLHPLRLLYRYGFESVVSRVTMLHKTSYAHVPRALRIPHGPQVIEN